MKVIQINSCMGYLLPPLLRLIEAERPDIVCAQEVINSSQPIPLSGNYRMPEHVQDAGGFEHVFYSPTWGFEAFGSHMDMGNAIFSKFPISDEQTVFTTGEYVVRNHIERFTYNIRNLQVCSVDVNGQQLHVANHQGYLAAKNPMGDDESLKSAQKVAASLSPYLDALVFCADLNFAKESPAFKPIAELGLRDLATENGVTNTLSEIHRAPPGTEVACDYIFSSKNLSVSSFYLPQKVVSDHVPLVAELSV